MDNFLINYLKKNCIQGLRLNNKNKNNIKRSTDALKVTNIVYNLAMIHGYDNIVFDSIFFIWHQNIVGF